MIIVTNSIYGSIYFIVAMMMLMTMMIMMKKKTLCREDEEEEEEEEDDMPSVFEWQGVYSHCYLPIQCHFVALSFGSL